MIIYGTKKARDMRGIKHGSLWLWIVAVAAFAMVGCSDDEPTPVPEPNPDNEPSIEQLEEEFWGDETPHWFHDHIDTLIIKNQTPDGFLHHMVDNELTDVWEWGNTPYPQATIYLVSKNKIDPVINKERYVEICRQWGCRPKSNRVTMPEVVNLPQFDMKQNNINYLVVDTLVNVDVIASDQYHDTISPGDFLNNNVIVSTQLYQRVIDHVAQTGTDARAPYPLMQQQFNSSGFKYYAPAIIGPWITLSFKGHGKEPGIHTFKVRITLKGQKPLETEFKIRFEDNVPNP